MPRITVYISEELLASLGHAPELNARKGSICRAALEEAVQTALPKPIVIARPSTRKDGKGTERAIPSTKPERYA